MAIIENFFNISPRKPQRTFEQVLEESTPDNLPGRIGAGLLGASDKLLGFGANIIGSTARSVFAKPAGELVSSVAELTGNEAPAWTRANRLASPEIMALLYGGGERKAEALKQQGYEGAGFTDVLNVASLIPGGGALKSGGIFSRVAKAASGTVARRTGTGFLSNAVKTAAELTPASIGWGSAYGAASGLDERDSAVGVLGKTLVGGAAGLAFAGAGGILSAGAASLLRTAPERARSRVTTIVNKRQEELSDIVAKNNKLSKIVENAKRNGNDIVGKLAEADTLVGSVSKDGAISTRGEGEALSKIDSVLDSVDSTIYDNIVRDGSTTSIDDLERALLKQVDDSGLVFAQKENALRRVRQEVRAMRKQSSGGVVPLADVQKAKIQIKANYLDPEKGAIDKMLKNAYKEYIEKNISSVDVQQANKELGELYAIRELVDSLHGKRVKGGRLGKYFAQTIGAIAGSKGGPLGSILGAEVAGNVQERMLASRFGSVTGKEVTAGEYLTKAAQRGKSPRLSLPAPKNPGAGSRVIEPGVIQLGEKIADEPRARIVDSAPIEQPKQAAIGYQGEGGFTGKPIPMGAPTTYEPRANIVGTAKLTLDDIAPPKVSDEVQNALTTLKTAEEFDAEVSKRVEELSAELPEEMKPHAEGILYEANPDVRALVDARDNANVIDVTPRSVSYVDEQIAKVDDDIKAITKEKASKKDIRTVLKDSGFSQWEDTRRGRAGTGGSLGDFSVKEESRKDYTGKRRVTMRKTGRTIVVPISEKAKREMRKALEKSGVKFSIAKGKDAVDAKAMNLGVYEYFVIE